MGMQVFSSAQPCRASRLLELWAAQCLELSKFPLVTLANDPNSYEMSRLWLLTIISESHLYIDFKLVEMLNTKGKHELWKIKDIGVLVWH